MAVTVTLTGNYHARLTGTGTMTLDELYLDLYSKAGDAETYMTRTGTPGTDAVYTAIYGTTGYFRIYIAGVTFELEDNDTLNYTWSNTSTTAWTLYIESTTSTLKIGENVYVDGNSNSATYARGYWGGNGNIVCDATEGNESEVTHFRSFNIYNATATPHDINYLKLTDTTYTNGYMWYMVGVPGSTSFYGDNVAHSFKNITISDVNGWGFFYMQYNDYTACTFENFTVDNLQVGYFYNTTIKIKDSTFKNSDDYFRHFNNGVSFTTNNYTTSKTKYFGNQRKQSLFIYENCTFDDQDDAANPGAGVYGSYFHPNNVALLKDCTWQNQTVGVYANDSTVLLYGTQTFDTVTTNKAWYGGGTFLHVRQLALTVNDPDGSPLENASVTIQQKEGKEVLQLVTDSNGNISSTDGAWVYLAEKEETSNGVYTQWSDGTGDQVHEIIVSHPDYATHKEEIAFTEDKTRTITLSENGGTNIYDSTIYDSTIY